MQLEVAWTRPISAAPFHIEPVSSFPYQERYPHTVVCRFVLRNSILCCPTRTPTYQTLINMWGSFLPSGLAREHLRYRPRLSKQNVEEGLAFHCKLPLDAAGKPTAPVSEKTFLNISSLLENLDMQDGREELSKKWSRRPRIYTILRHIGGIILMERFAESWITDLLLPFDPSTIPWFVKEAGLDKQFLEIQGATLTAASQIETSFAHAHFKDDAGHSYTKICDLGQGGSG